SYLDNNGRSEIGRYHHAIENIIQRQRRVSC
ncbi:MAG: hypothetical protein ACI92G_003857, partial [Candidatus Pelagisphaera sp.]